MLLSVFLKGLKLRIFHIHHTVSGHAMSAFLFFRLHKFASYWQPIED
jgi:hypothetical protein